MSKYHASFNGRLIGADGVRYPIITSCEGDTPEQARLALYDRYEHISELRLIPQPDEEDGPDKQT